MANGTLQKIPPPGSHLWLRHWLWGRHFRMSGPCLHCVDVTAATYTAHCQRKVWGEQMRSSLPPDCAVKTHFRALPTFQIWKYKSLTFLDRSRPLLSISRSHFSRYFNYSRGQTFKTKVILAIASSFLVSESVTQETVSSHKQSTIHQWGCCFLFFRHYFLASEWVRNGLSLWGTASSDRDSTPGRIHWTSNKWTTCSQ